MDEGGSKGGGNATRFRRGKMSLKRIYDDVAEVPEALREFYEEKDGRAVLILEDGGGGEDTGALKRALEAERRQRAKAEKALGSLKGDLGDMTPAQAREALQKLAELEEKDLLNAGNFDEAGEKRAGRRISEFKTAYEKAEAEKGELSKKLESVLVDSALRTAALDAGIVPSAVDDAVLLGKTVFRLHEGAPVAVGPDGEPMPGEKPGESLTMEKWLSARATDRPHWFGQNAGGGAGGSLETAPRGGVIRLSREQAKDPGTYRAAREQAAKTGAQIEYTE